MRIVKVLWFCLMCNFVIAQSPNDIIDPNRINFSLLENLFQEQLNELRRSKGLGTIVMDVVLAKAGQDQAEYQNRINKLTHDQITKGKETPTDRVLFYKGLHSRVGENCILIYIGTPVKDKSGAIYTIATYQEAATELFKGWFNSPPHYQNMITPYYENAGLGFSYNPRTKQLYAAQVFGTKPYSAPYPEYSNTENSWGVKSSDSKICSGYGSYQFVAGIFSNYLVIDGDSIFQYYMSEKDARNILSGPNDGIAIDIIFREQLTCARNHNFHPSLIHDGIMLKPVYSTQLFAKNQRKSTGEFYTFVGLLPKNIQSKSIQLNTILIRNGVMCTYSYPVTVVSENHNLLKLRPKWAFYEGEVEAASFKSNFSFDIPFKNADDQISEETRKMIWEKALIYAPFITDLTIRAFSSVDGPEKFNLELQNKRAKNILEIFNSLLDPKVKVTLEAKENWTMFNEQILNTPYEYFKKFDKESIKKKLSNKTTRDSLLPFLDVQRVAKLNFSVDVKYDNKSSNFVLPLALFNTIQRKDSLQSRIIHSRLTHALVKEEISPDQYCETDVPLDRKFLPVLSNYVGAYAMSNKFSTDDRFDFIRSALELGRDYYRMKFNFVIYALRYWSERGQYIVDPDEMEKVIQTFRADVEDSLVDNMLLNYYVTSAYYFFEAHQYTKMYHSLEGIRELYPKTLVDLNDAKKLMLLFNMYYKFEWSMPLMKPFITSGKFDEDALFLYTRTACLYRSAVTDDELLALLKQYIQYNKTRYCNWINREDWQLLRIDWMKDLYCATCQ